MSDYKTFGSVFEQLQAQQRMRALAPMATLSERFEQLQAQQRMRALAPMATLSERFEQLQAQQAQQFTSILERAHQRARRVDAVRVANLPNYAREADALLHQFGLPPVNSTAFSPSADDSVFDAIAERSPEVAEAIAASAERIGTPFWKKHAVRNGLALVLAGAVLSFFVATGYLPPQWAWIGGVASGLLPNAPDTYRALAAREDTD